MKNTKSRLVVIDTNVLIEDPGCINTLGHNNIVIPITVLEELDEIKTRKDDVGKSARRAVRTLEELIEAASAVDAVKLPQGGSIRVECNCKLNALLTDDSPDNRILSAALNLFIQEYQAAPENFAFITRDVNLRLKAKFLGLPTEGYDPQSVLGITDELYFGVTHRNFDSMTHDDLESGHQTYLTSHESEGLFPNQFVIAGQENDTEALRTKIIRFVSEDKPVIPIKSTNVCGIKPKNTEQQMAINLLLDDEIKLVTLVGPAGTGKTLLAVAAGVDKILDGGKTFSKLIVTKPIQSVGKDIGFLPGTLQEKMEPWIAPIKDNLQVLFSGNKKRGKKDDRDSSPDPYLALMIEKGQIEVEAISFIRGRSIANAFMIIDEAQNLSVHELKTILTRAGNGTKIVLTGDIEQIDNVGVDAFSNGLTYAIEKFKDQKIAGHMTLLKGERSELATISSKIL